ncbi:MAG: RNA methyltransferase [Candidatus Saganbacteria bacterium]|nr:RNA methyltransferase [Candidatus Saganbacteria bacterium]
MSSSPRFPIYIALLHYPVYNKRKKVVATCITTFDLHDIARSAATFGIKKYFVVNPMPAQLEFAGRILKYWARKEGKEHNWTRAAAISLVELKKDLAEVVRAIKKREKRAPLIVGTSAKTQDGMPASDLLKEASKKKRPVLLVFGTGWGMTEEVLEKCDYMLQPIVGSGQYNHLSVRSAVAIILDRLGRER